MAAVTTFLGEPHPGHPLAHRVPRAAIARTQSPGRARYWRRRLAVVGVAAGLVVVAAQAGDALGGSPLAAPGRRPAPAVVEVTVRPGDTLWSIVERTFPGQDPRTRVDDLVRARHGTALVPGEVVEVPR
jgi:hypothetical protein